MTFRVYAPFRQCYGVASIQKDNISRKGRISMAHVWEGTARCELWKPVWFFHLLYLFPIHACICKFCIVVASSFLLIRMAPSKHMESLNQYSLFESGLGSFRFLKSFTPIPFHIILQLLQSMCWRSSCMNAGTTYYTNFWKTFWGPIEVPLELIKQQGSRAVYIFTYILGG